MLAGTSHYPYTSSYHDLFSVCKDNHNFWFLQVFLKVFILPLHSFSPFPLPFPNYLLLLHLHLPRAAVMSFENDGADGWSTTYWKALSRFVFGCSKLRNFRMVVKSNAGITPRGVVYTLRSVSWRSSTFWHTLRCIVYSHVGVSLSVYHHRFPKTSNNKQADASTHVFYFVVSQVVTNPFARGVCGQLFTKR